MTESRKAPGFVPPEDRRTVTVKPHSYQPNKAELEEPLDLRKADGTKYTLDDAAKALMRPVNVVEDSDA